MAETTIEWTAQHQPDGRVIPGFTFNPWIGCSKVHEGCAHCYAERDFDTRRHVAKWGLHGTRIVTSEANWKKPLAWNRKAEAEGVRYRVFCSSLADVFEDWTGKMLSSRKVEDDWSDHEKFNPVLWHRDDIGVCEAGQTTVHRVRGERLATMADVRRKLFKLIDATPHLDWLLLTKRPENVLRMWPCEADTDGDGDGDCEACSKGRTLCKKFRHNVWLGTSISLQAHADKQIPELLRCRRLSPVLFVSGEPLLGEIDIGMSVATCGCCERWPSRWIELPHRVSGDWPIGHETFAEPGIYRANSNAHGALSVTATNGKLLGIRPHEMRVLPGLDWVIAGNESGPKARPGHPHWGASLLDQCQTANIPFLWKQWGEWLPVSEAPMEVLTQADSYAQTGVLMSGKFGDQVTPEVCDAEQDLPMLCYRVGKQAAGRMLNGVEWNQSPTPHAKAVS